MLFKICGAIEHDECLRERGNYREFLATKSKYVCLVNPKLSTSVTLRSFATRLFRLKYVRDVVLFPTLEESNLGVFTSMIASITSDICSLVFGDIQYLTMIFHIIVRSIEVEDIDDRIDRDYNADSSNDFRHSQNPIDAMKFLQELFKMSKTLQYEQCTNLFLQFLDKMKEHILTLVLHLLKRRHHQDDTDTEITLRLRVVIIL